MEYKSNLSNKVLWDAVKGVGYLCVLMGHMDLTKYIFNFHMPLFFLVSGMFYTVSGGSRRILRNIFVPWVYFFVIATVYHLLGSSGVDSRRLLETTYMGRPYVLNSLWFLTCLGVLQLLSLRLFPCLDQMRLKKTSGALLLVLCLISGFAVSQLPRPEQSYLPLMLGAVPMALFFFAIGHWLRGGGWYI